MSMAKQHFLTLLDFSPADLMRIIERAIDMKRERREGVDQRRFPGSVLAMVFAKSSTRTRVSFEAGIAQLGGHALFLSPRDTQLGRGEPIEDTARVLSSMADIIMVRTFEHEKIIKFAEYSSVPVINGLTDLLHPCQLLADMQAWIEHRGDMQGKTATYVGDGNNMCHSYINAACQLDFRLNIACPEGYDPDPALLETAGSRVNVFRDPQAACKNVDLIVTDVWASMGQEDEQKERENVFSDYQVNDALMA